MIEDELPLETVHVLLAMASTIHEEAERGRKATMSENLGRVLCGAYKELQLFPGSAGFLPICGGKKKSLEFQGFLAISVCPSRPRTENIPGCMTIIS